MDTLFEKVNDNPSIGTHLLFMYNPENSEFESSINNLGDSAIFGMLVSGKVLGTSAKITRLSTGIINPHKSDLFGAAREVNDLYDGLGTASGHMEHPYRVVLFQNGDRLERFKKDLIKDKFGLYL